MLSSFLPVGAIALSYLLHADAAPGLTPKPVQLPKKRYNTLVDCDEEQEKKAGRALADMVELASQAYSEAGTDKYGFNHYFKDDELDTFKSAMSTIARNNDPTNAPSYAITEDGVPKDDNDLKSIWLCPLFFKDGVDTKNDLPRADDADARRAWCDQKDYTLFPTA
ncbi:MAG: hypothetical protein Q9181_006425, partial [Wetmoreana brouardii]